MKKLLAIVLSALMMTTLLPLGTRSASAEINDITARNIDDTKTAVTDINADEVVYNTDSTSVVQVTFVCMPEELILTVYEKTEDGTERALRKVSPEMDGGYRLRPGSYLYSATAEGYIGLSDMPLTVEAREMNLPIKVYVSLSMKPFAASIIERSETDMDVDSSAQAQDPIKTVTTEDDDPDPEEPDEGELHEQQIIARAYSMYNNIVNANGSIEAYINLITARKNSLQITLNEAELYNAYYSTYIKLSSTMVKIGITALAKSPSEALVGVGKSFIGQIVDQGLDLPKISTKDFIYSQAHEGLRSLSKDELWNVIDRRNAGEELFPTAESAVNFILEVQNNKAAFASGEMGKEYYYDQINQSPWDTIGTIAVDVAVSLISDQFKEENEDIFTWYMRGKVSKLIGNCLDLIVGQIGNPHVNEWYDQLKEIEKETEYLLKYNPPYTIPDPVYYTVTYDTAEPYDKAFVMEYIYEENDDVYVPKPFRFGYDFLGWYDANGVQFTAFDTITSDMTLYSHWRRIILDSDLCGDALVYTLYGDGLLEITGSGEMTSHPWTSRYTDRIGEVHLPEGLTSICNNAFEYCDYLHEVNVPSTVKAIGYEAFSGSGITSLTLPDGVETLGYSMINGCPNLKELTVPGSVVNMGNNSYCGSFSISSLEKVTIGEGITTIGSYAFTYCSELKEVHLPSSLEEIGWEAFYYCTSLEHIDISESVKRIDGQAFGYTGLTELILPANIETIGQGILTANTGVTSLFIPKTYVDGWCITQGSAVTRIEFEEGIEEIPNRALEYGEALIEIVLPSTVKAIGYEAFSGSGITSLTLPDGVETLGYSMINGCPNLKELTVPGSVVNMGNNSYCGSFSISSLEKVTIGEGITTIGSYAFTYCSELKEVHLPSSLEHIMYCSFYDCTALTDVYYQGTEQQKEAYLHIANNNESLNNATWHYLTPAFTPEVEWNAEDVNFKGTTAYVIANGKAQTPRFTVKNKADGSVIDPMFYDYEYKENTKAGTGYVFVTFKSAYEGTCRGTFKIYLQPTTTTTVANIEDGIKLSWSKVAGADGYVIYRRAWSSTTNGWTDFVRWNNTKELNWLDTKVYAGTRYQYGIKAYFNKRIDPVTGATIGGNVGDNFNLGEVGPLKTTVRITTRTLNSVTAGSKQMTVKWGASSQFTGYQIQYATNSAFTQNAKAVKIANPKTASTVIKSLTTGKTYYVRVRSYHVFNGMTYFGGWSNVKSCKVK